MDVRKMRNEKLGARVVAALESRNMEAYYVETKEEAVKKALELIPKGSSINMGGAASVKECGLYDAISNGEYEFYDRDKVKTPEEKEEIARKAFSSDYFLGSVNAMSEDGVFINIDGNANRVAAYAYGPKHVLLIVGMNKVVKSEEDAIDTLKQITDEQEDFQDGSAAYYLAQSYRKNGDLKSAKPYYQYVIENYPDTERARTSQNYVDAQE